jgi:hypothetical protein
MGTTDVEGDPSILGTTEERQWGSTQTLEIHRRYFFLA